MRFANVPAAWGGRGKYADGYEGLDRLTVANATRRLGVQEQAIHKRRSHDTLSHDEAEDGGVYVYIASEPEDEVQGMDTRGDTYRDALVESLQDQNRFLREELAHKNAILMRQLTAPLKGACEDAPGSPGSPGLTQEVP